MQEKKKSNLKLDLFLITRKLCKQFIFIISLDTAPYLISKCKGKQSIRSGWAAVIIQLFYRETNRRTYIFIDKYAHIHTSCGEISYIHDWMSDMAHCEVNLKRWCRWY